MNTVWVLIIAFFTPETGTQLMPITMNPEGAYYQSFEECIADGVRIFDQAIAEGLPENAINGDCLLVEVDENGYPIRTETTASE